MIYLAIETSCDETSVAVFEDRKLIRHYVYSQVETHKKWGGVVPEVASRYHSEKISHLIKKLGIKKLDLVGFTRGPGLKGSLLVGKVSAFVLSEFFKCPIMGLNHLEGHFLSPELAENKIVNKIKFPCIGLLISGGHTELWYSKGYGNYKVIGKTRDDACGEAFDKVAKMLNLGYPGGPIIDKMSKKLRKEVKLFSVPDVKNSFDYSFSGIKTQVAYYVRDLKKITQMEKLKIVKSFQSCVVESLLNKLELAVNRYRVRNIVVCGGVSANSFLRKELYKRFKGFNIFLPQRIYCQDNAAMMGVCIYRRIERGIYNSSVLIDDNLVSNMRDFREN
jgi:N6-L-threonylcarbamoyladenine synthase